MIPEDATPEQVRALVAACPQAERWHFGKKVTPGGKKRPWWINRWLAHPCADLALGFEVGARAAAAGLPEHLFDRS